MDEKFIAFTLRVPAELAREIEEAAARDERSRAAFILRMLRNGMAAYKRSEGRKAQARRDRS